MGFPDSSVGKKESTCNAGDLVSIPGLGRSSGEGKGYPLQYSGLENSMDSVVHGVAKSRTQLSDFISDCIVLKHHGEKILNRFCNSAHFQNHFPYFLLLLLLLLSRFSRVRLCATPQTAAHQAPLSLGFSRQEHWSGLPFPSPVFL